MNQPRHVSAALALLVLASLACTFGGLLAPRPSPQPTERARPSATAQPSEAPASAPATVTAAAVRATDELPPTQPAAASPTPGRVPAAGLSPAGPWLLVPAEDGYWAVNPDGTGLTRVLDRPTGFAPRAVAPRGGHAAFLSAADEAGERGLTLNLLRLPDGAVTAVAPLTNRSTEPGPNAGIEAYDILLPLGQMAWSPDGGRLAFIGAQDGPSADLYVYDLATGAVTRLTDGASHAYAPSWSPDGQYIVQFGAHTFGTGAGYSMAGVWAARADGTAVKTLYAPDSQDETLLGWLRPDSFVVESAYVYCHKANLRVVNVETLAVEPIFAGDYNSAAVDLATGTALVAVDDFVAGCRQGGQAGLFLAAPGAEPRRIAEAPAGWATVAWSPAAQRFFVQVADQPLLAFTPAGEPAPLPAEMTAFPVVGPGGSYWAWTGPEGYGLYVAQPGSAPRQLHEGFIYRPIWSPAGRSLLFHADGAFYAAAAPDFTPALVAAELPVTDQWDLAWVQP